MSTSRANAGQPFLKCSWAVRKYSLENESNDRITARRSTTTALTDEDDSPPLGRRDAVGRYRLRFPPRRSLLPQDEWVGPQVDVEVEDARHCGRSDGGFVRAAAGAVDRLPEVAARVSEPPRFQRSRTVVRGGTPKVLSLEQSPIVVAEAPPAGAFQKGGKGPGIVEEDPVSHAAQERIGRSRQLVGVVTFIVTVSRAAQRPSQYLL